MGNWSQRRSETVEESNALFARIRDLVEEEVRRGAEDIDVLEVVNQAGLSIDEGTLHKLQVDRNVTPLTFLPWYMWFPWRTLWAYFWAQRFPKTPAAQYLPHDLVPSAEPMAAAESRPAEVSSMVVTP